METRAAVLDKPTDAESFTEAHPTRVRTIDVEKPTGDEVLVEMVAASLCGTDVAIARGDLERECPLVMGHEGAGVVHGVGPDVTSVEPGDHVVLGRIACGQCSHCRAGRSYHCTRRSEATDEGTLRSGRVGFSDGRSSVYHCHGVSSFSEYTLVDEEVAIGITDDLPLEQASVLGCGMITGVGAATRTAEVEPGTTAAVFGLGGVGLSVIQGARLAGAREIIAVDVVSEKLSTAAEVGATATVDASTEDPIDAIRDITDGGVDYAFDAVGQGEVTEQAIEVLARRGEAVLVGHPSPGKRSLDIDLFRIVKQEWQIHGSYNGSSNHLQGIPVLAEFAARGDLSLEALITDTKRLEEVNRAIKDLETGTEIRQVLLP